jgi:hypothetical protein
MSRKVKYERTELKGSIEKLLPKIDFSDTFSTTNHINSMEEIVNLVFNTTPNWIRFLFSLRNKISPLFGLKREMPNDYKEGYEVGKYIKSFKYFSIADTEVVVGADDSHLNFRLIISIDRLDFYNVKLTTIVEYKNLKGRVYMNTIMPFHKLIVKRMIKSAVMEK